MARFGRAYPLGSGRRRYQKVTFDAVGAGNVGTAGFAGTVSATWNHTASLFARAVTVGYSSRCGGQTPASQTSTVTYGGIAMSLLATLATNSEQFTEVWGLIGPPTGVQSVVVTSGNGTNTGRSIVANSVSYNGVSAFGPVQSSGLITSATAALTVTGQVGQYFNVVIGAASTSQSALTQTSRYNASDGSGFADVSIQDALGAASVAFGSTLGASVPWCAFGVPLLPARL